MPLHSSVQEMSEIEEPVPLEDSEDIAEIKEENVEEIVKDDDNLINKSFSTEEAQEEEEEEDNDDNWSECSSSSSEVCLLIIALVLSLDWSFAIRGQFVDNIHAPICNNASRMRMES